MTEQEMIDEVIEVLGALLPTIEDDYRATDDPDDDQPGIMVTFATDADCGAVLWQSGENSYSGACYSLPYWGVVSLYRDSDVADVARDAVDQMLDQVAEALA